MIVPQMDYMLCICGMGNVCVDGILLQDLNRHSSWCGKGHTEPYMASKRSGLAKPS